MPDTPSVDCIVLDSRDNVAVAVSPLEPGHAVSTSAGVVDVLEPIPAGHKVALVPIAQDENVIKYGEPIGHATQPIRTGAHVHTHNLVGNRLGVPQ